MFSFRTTPLEDQLDKSLTEGRVGCFSTQNSYDIAKGRYVWDIFRERGNLARIFSPRDTELTPLTNHIEFSLDEISGLSAVVVEIQDVGSRYFNYTKDVFRLMEMLMLLGDAAPSLYIVDHANPAGRAVEGSMPLGKSEMYVPKVAHRHGLTLGELCFLYHNEISASFPLHVISAAVSDANRQLMPWTIAPASDIPGLFTCLVYPGGALWNNTTISPAIGTARPYEYIGAPFVKTGPYDNIPSPKGVIMRPCSFTPSCGMYSGERCYGYQIILTGEPYHSLLHTVRLIRFFKDRYSQFELSDAFRLKLADPALEAYIDDEISLQDAMEHVKTEEQKWIRKAKRFLLYDDPPYRMK
ncbi:MAG: DUF1343 domain-containing protein [Bacteroidales bacterium]|nr:DUF1343 domain-containing protein [Bacteroidales bacterium]